MKMSVHVLVAMTHKFDSFDGMFLVEIMFLY